MFEIFHNEFYEFYINNIFTIDNYVTFDVHIKDHEFAGVHSFCMDRKSIEKIIEALQKAYDEFTGIIEIVDFDSESRIELIVDKFQVQVYGQLGSEWESNLLKFEQRLDQSIINLLIKCFKKLISQL